MSEKIANKTTKNPVKKILNKSDFDELLTVLKDMQYELYGPQLKDDAIVYDLLSSQEQLPQNISDDQRPGQYSVSNTQTGRWFAWANAVQGIKPLVFVPVEKLWSATHDTEIGLSFNPVDVSEKPRAIIGVRNCDLAGLRLQDQHFLEQEYVDPYYQSRRQNLFLVAVNCTHPAATCFCHRTGDGPIANNGYDLVFDELEDVFVVSAGSDKGQDVIDLLPVIDSREHHLTQVSLQRQQVNKSQMSSIKPMTDIDIQKKLNFNFETDAWDDIAKRCLACGNCTSVCPTCFCYSERDVPATGEDKLDLSISTYIREWDSCFNQSHSYIHGIVIRPETKFRYRQWLSHKFSTWFDQYGRSGCVGCGRCVTWCPVGIDVIEVIGTVCEKRECSEEKEVNDD